MENIMKKTAKFALTLAASLIFSSVVPAFADNSSQFSDISDEKYSWAVSYIEDMCEKGFIKGYEDGTYRPDNSITRLEALSLFSRIMRSGANEGVLDAANAQYKNVVEALDLNFGNDDIAYLLYRGALKESELPTYLDKDLRNEPMPRHEAAAVITKAMCAEKQVSSEIMVVLDYTDAKKIPTNASKYVYYVTEQGIMSGMGDGTFSPLSGVLRSQMAVMLSKTVDAMSLSVENLKIAGIDNSNVYFFDDTMDPETDEPQAMGYSEDTKFFLEGQLVQAKNVPSNVSALFTYVKNELAFVDIANGIPDKEVTGIYQGASKSADVYTVAIKTSEGVESYRLAEDAEIIFANNPATIRNFTDTSKVTAYISNGEIVKIKGDEKSSSINKATIEEISIIDDGTITISHANDAYNGLKLEVSPDVKVIKNDMTASLVDVYKGDVVTLSLEYGVVTELRAESTRRIVEGTISKIEISNNPKVTVNVKGEPVEYDVTSDIEIVVNNREGTLYDFRVGDSVTITLESKAIKKIVTTSSAGVSASKTGVVSAANDSYQFIKITYTDNDVNYEETVYCNDKSTTFITSEGTKKELKDIKEGDVVSVRGTVTNGAFEANLVIIEVE